MIVVLSAAAEKPASTAPPATEMLLKLRVVSKATAAGTLGATFASDLATSILASSSVTAGSVTPALVAATIAFFTFAFCALIAVVTGAIEALSLSTRGCLSELSTMCWTVARSSAGPALGAPPGAAWWISAFSWELLWLYSSGIPSRWPYSWAAMIVSSLPYEVPLFR